MTPSNVFWFRRDLRADDNHALHQALKSGRHIEPIFIFDDCILESLPAKDARVEFIRAQLKSLSDELKSHGLQLTIHHGRPLEVWPKILRQHQPQGVYCNEDYEPYARERDAQVAQLVRQAGAEFHAVKDQVIFAKDEIVKEGGEPYRVFTPYSKRWLKAVTADHFKPFKTSFANSSGVTLHRQRLKDYGKTRDRLDLDATTRLGVHLRFGTVSVRKTAALAKELSPVFLNELMWREFFMQVLFHFPHTVSEPFDSRYKKIPWRDNEKDFQRWCDGETGYPLVDAGMRELNQTGFMHNRARMVTASFLTKHLLIDWRKGERYFALKLMDFELAANVGNWQWAAGCGCDAAPYFRVFNPDLQAKKFDPQGLYVKKWVPEVNSAKYPKPMVEHEVARNRAIKTFTETLKAKA